MCAAASTRGSSGPALSSPSPHSPSAVPTRPLPIGPLNPFDASHLPLPSPSPLSSFLDHAFLPGRVYYNADASVEYTAGSLPLIISVPHGGHKHSALPAPTSSPSPTAVPSVPSSTLPDRVRGCMEKDLNTQELGRALHAALLRRLPSHPAHLIIARIHRRKVDFNRSREDCSDCDGGRQAFDDYQRCVLRAKRAIADAHGTQSAPQQRSDDAQPPGPRWTDGRVGLFVDLHGQRHDARCQLGYLLNAEDLRSLDSAAPPTERLSLFGLWRGSPSGASLEDIVRGAHSLGRLLELRGFPCVPSPSSLAPEAGALYFNGGYNTATHGSAPRSAARKKERLSDGGAAAECWQAEVDLGDRISSVQVETALHPIRDSAAHRAHFAEALADALMDFLERHAPPPGPPRTQSARVSSAGARGRETDLASGISGEGEQRSNDCKGS